MTDWPELARQLDLAPHPKGGWFREIWRSKLAMSSPVLPPGHTGPRNAGTAILYLLMPGQEASWHTARCTEVWLYHFGGPLRIDVGSERASSTTHLLGTDIARGQQLQLTVPSGHWQRAQLHDDEPSLVSCIAVPGVDDIDNLCIGQHS
jgi:predicted cupin superfamily sugar epimerase